jgi:hypothetical protein
MGKIIDRVRQRQEKVASCRLREQWNERRERDLLNWRPSMPLLELTHGFEPPTGWQPDEEAARAAALIDWGGPLWEKYCAEHPAPTPPPAQLLPGPVFAYFTDEGVRRVTVPPPKPAPWWAFWRYGR